MVADEVATDEEDEVWLFFFAVADEADEAELPFFAVADEEDEAELPFFADADEAVVDAGDERRGNIASNSSSVKSCLAICLEGQ